MALTVEDGTNVAGANSLVEHADILAYAAARGLAFPSAEADGEPYAIRAMDYLQAQRARYQGTKTYPTQSLQLPRTGMVIDGIDFPSDAIPQEAKDAQCVLAIEAYAGTALLPTTTGQFIVEDTVGPITTKYSEKVGTTAEPEISAADALLAPLFQGTGGFTLRTLRI